MTYSANSRIIINTSQEGFFANVNLNAAAFTSNIIGSSLQGTVAGFFSGGANPPSTYTNVINKFPFASDSSNSDFGDLSVARSAGAGQSSQENGFNSGGLDGSSTAGLNTIDVFSFASNTVASDVGDLSINRFAVAGQSSSSNGYVSGGARSTTSPYLANDTIDKFPFASGTPTTDVGNLFQAVWGSSGNSSAVSGYSSSGAAAGAGTVDTNVIQKFPFASDTNGSDVGDLTTIRQYSAGCSSDFSGYTSGGDPGVNVIEKFPFSSDTNATDIADLTAAKRYVAGTESTVSGYIAGGSPNQLNTLEKFPFATDSNASDVGDLIYNTNFASGQRD